MKPAIRVENLAKSYQLGSCTSGTYRTLRETITDSAAAAWRGLRGRLSGSGNGSANGAVKNNSFWALKDVSFEVQPGEVVGVIGRNGAGKSTLLKILSRITDPTKGRAVIRGRIGSLLEVGTGFHQELTGRENIYMTGSILGMGLREIDRKFDEIVSFADIEEFLDTPVKRYSSGMYVRLGFAIAAHLEPEILVVDEVLAVGDVAFQKKCLGKMEAVAKNGRTVLFVSHNIGSVRTLCNRGLLLSEGQLIANGPIDDVVDSYLRSFEKQASSDLASRTDRGGKGGIRLRHVQVSMGAGFPPSSLMRGQPARFEFELSEARDNVHLGFTIHDHRGMAVCTQNTWRRAPYDCISSEGGKYMICDMDELALRPGRYFLSAIIIHNKEVEDQIDAAAFFDVDNGDYRGRTLPYTGIPGVVCLDHKWTIPSKSSLSSHK